MHNSIAQQKVASNGDLHEFSTLVLHPTVNYGPFNFTIMANGGGAAENSGFSRPHSGKSGKETMQKLHPPAVYNYDSYSGYHLEDLEEIKLPRILELGK